MSEQSHGLLEVRDAVRHLEQRIEVRLGAFEQRIETRLDAADHRLEARYEALEQRAETRHDSVGRRIEALEDKVSRQFVWTVGVQVTTFVAIVAALLSRG